MNNLKNKLLDFILFCRDRGYVISPQQTLEAFELVKLDFFLYKNSLKYALKAICCNNKGNAQIFDELFNRFWDRTYSGVLKEQKRKSTPKKNQNQNSSLMYLGNSASTKKQEQESKEVTGANQRDRLCKTDFSQLSITEAEELNQLTEELFHQVSLRIKRRLISANSGIISIKETIRNSISKGGVPCKLKFKKKKKEKRKLVFLLDISGSMDTYSFYLLRFVMILRLYFKELEFFTFSTNLKRITPYLHKENKKKILTYITSNVNNWSGGTKIGESLTTFLKVYGNKLLTQKHIIVILSDGLETGNVGELKKTVSEIKLRCKTLMWLNPLKGTSGYQPLQKGIVSVLPHLDIFESANNLNSLLKLEQYLNDI